MQKDFSADELMRVVKGQFFVSQRISLLLVCLSLLLFAGCTKSAAKFDETAHAEEIEEWRSERLADLKSENGWLTLTGLYWLKEGENRFGTDKSNEIVLPNEKAPKVIGSLWLKDGKVRLEARPGVDVTSEGKPVASVDLQSDADGKPTVFNLGPLSFQVIKRGDGLGLRVKDKESPARANFRGLEFFPASSRWRFDARFEPFNPPKSVPIVNVLGMQEDEPSPGAIVFELNGQTYRLDALTEAGEKQFFIIFADETSGRETYGAGRYLYAGPPDTNGHIILDFNKAYSPPCAFTNFATCPLPPPQNRLPIRVEAGEKFSGH